MKPIILFFILSLITCKTAIDKISCVAKNENFFDELVKVMESIKTKDLQKIISTLFAAYFNLKDDIKKCFSDKEEFEPTLQNPIYNPIKLEKCKMMCGDYYYDEKCINKCYEKYGDGTFPINDILLKNDDVY